jgi:uncharacterized membrane protein
MTRRDQRRRQRPARAAEPAAPASRAWEVVGLAAAGFAIAAYLTATKLLDATPLFCTAGSSCDVVQASRYATALGLPTALWGAGLYAALGILAAWPLTPPRWLWAFAVAVAGAAFSAYLTAVALWVLGAACVWCLASAVIMLALVVALLLRRPPPGSRRVWLRPARVAALGGVVAAATIVLAYGIFIDVVGPSTPYQEGLARHLAATGARFYGAYWCPHCREQKELFGGAAALLPYVECDPGGAGARPELCAMAGVKVFPTWVIGGTRHDGLLPLDALARLSGFTPPPARP